MKLIELERYMNGIGTGMNSIIGIAFSWKKLGSNSVACRQMEI